MRAVQKRIPRIKSDRTLFDDRES